MPRKRRRVNNKALLAIGGALFVSAAVPVATGLMHQQTLIAQNAAEAATYKPKPVVLPTTAVLKVANFQTVAKKLRDAKAPFTLAVIGDSTSYPKQGWVEVMAQSISERSGRQVNVQTWNLDTGKYDPVHSYGQGAPVLTIWNGSAPGRDAMYSVTNLGTLLPPKPDLVMVNHGHNVTAPEAIRTLIYRIAETSGNPAMAVTKQNPRLANRGGAIQAEKMQVITSMVGEMPGVTLVDAFSIFPKDPASWLSSDGVHPNPEGYRAWADAVLVQLGFDSP